jgi:ABC-type multidrug transport system ATPase subunit
LAYAAWSARLAGVGRTEANARAQGALEKLGVRGESRALLRGASQVVRRATSIAAALATGARAIFVEDPTPSLDDDAAASLLTLVERALDGRAWGLFAARAPLTSPLVAAAEEALVFMGGALVEKGAPTALATRERRYAVDAQGAGESLATKVAGRGITVESVVTGPGCARFVVELPEGGTTRDLFACAEEAGAVVVELRPIARAFA